MNTDEDDTETTAAITEQVTTTGNPAARATRLGAVGEHCVAVGDSSRATDSSNSGYLLRFEPVGPQDPVLGSPTQLAVFDKAARAAGQGAV